MVLIHLQQNTQKVPKGSAESTLLSTNFHRPYLNIPTTRLIICCAKDIYLRRQQKRDLSIFLLKVGNINIFLNALAFCSYSSSLKLIQKAITVFKFSLLLLSSFSFPKSVIHKNKPGRMLEASRDDKPMGKLRKSRYGQLSD